MTEQETRELLTELLRLFYAKGWVSGTGGGICGPADGGGLLLAPTGVHKERVRPDEFFTVDPADGRVLRSPDDASLRPSECNSIFCLAARERGARSVVHSHGLSAVIAGDLAGDVAAAVEADRLTDADTFKRTYLGHGSQSSVFVFQGQPGPFRTHVHETHDEIGYVLRGTGSVTVGGMTRPVKQGDVWVIPANTPHRGQFEDAPQVLFISSPIDDPDNQDRVWLD